MKYFRKSRRGRNYRKRGIKRARPVRKVSKSIRNYVKKAIHRQIENKEVFTYAVNSTLSSVIGNVTPSGIPLIRAIGQGTDNAGRIGNQLKIVKGVIRGHVNIKPYNATTNPLSTPIYVRLMLIRNLAITEAQSGLTSFSYDNFWKGNSTGLPFQGNMLDMNFTPNPDVWRLLGNKVFKIGASSATSAGQVGTGGYYDNSPMSVPFYFNWGKFCKKQLKYKDAYNYPENDNIYLIVLTCNADGSTTATEPAEWHYVSTMQYEDA